MNNENRLSFVRLREGREAETRKMSVASLLSVPSRPFAEQGIMVYGEEKGRASPNVRLVFVRRIRHTSARSLLAAKQSQTWLERVYGAVAGSVPVLACK